MRRARRARGACRFLETSPGRTHDDATNRGPQFWHKPALFPSGIRTRFTVKGVTGNGANGTRARREKIFVVATPREAILTALVATGTVRRCARRLARRRRGARRPSAACARRWRRVGRPFARSLRRGAWRASAARARRRRLVCRPPHACVPEPRGGRHAASCLIPGSASSGVTTRNLPDVWRIGLSNLIADLCQSAFFEAGLLGRLSTFVRGERLPSLFAFCVP